MDSKQLKQTRDAYVGIEEQRDRPTSEFEMREVPNGAASSGP